MSAFNWFLTKKKAYELRTKQFTTAAGVITYTARTGRTADNFVVDRVIRVTTVSSYNLTITLPNGVFYGQRCLVICEVNGGTSDTVDVTTTTGDNATQITAAGGYSDLVWMGSTLGWVELSNETT